MCGAIRHNSFLFCFTRSVLGDHYENFATVSETLQVSAIKPEASPNFPVPVGLCPDSEITHYFYRNKFLQAVGKIQGKEIFGEGYIRDYYGLVWKVFKSAHFLNKINVQFFEISENSQPKFLNRSVVFLTLRGTTRLFPEFASGAPLAKWPFEMQLNSLFDLVF